MTSNNIDELIRRSLINTKPVLTVDEAVDYTGLAKSSLYKLTASRKIPHYKPIGKKLYFDREELDTWLLKNRIDTQKDRDQRASDILFELERREKR